MNNNLLILASGLGERVYMFTYAGALPKCMLSVGNETCIEAIVCNNCTAYDNVYVVVHKQHKAALQALFTAKHITSVHIIDIDLQNSPMDSLRAAFACIPNYDMSNWTITWSDIITDLSAFANVTRNTIVTDNKYCHRNIAFIGENGIEVHKTYSMTGNVPGIFSILGTALTEVLACTDYADFDIAMSRTVPTMLSRISTAITDIGDYAKYTAYMLKRDTSAVCRYFNDISFDKHVVYKKPLTEQGARLHNIEVAYYKAFSKDNALAKLIAYNPATKLMTLERIKGKTCQSYVDTKPDKQSKLTTVNNLLAKFATAVKSLHDLPVENCKDTVDDCKAALYAELYDGIKQRVEPCKSMIDAVLAAYDDIKTVDDMPICSYDNLLEAVKQWLDAKIAENYFDFGIVHGDPNTDNTMVETVKMTIDGKNKSVEQIRFVDPRGYFGKLRTLGYGPKQYDYAKFVYGFSGYSRFNRAEYIESFYDTSKHNLMFFIGKAEHNGITDVDLLKMNIDTDIKVLVAIIWTRLTSYIINDPMKSVAAYLHGNALLTELLNIKPL